MYITKPSHFNVSLEKEEKEIIEDCVDILLNLIETAESHNCDVYETLYDDNFTTDEIDDIRKRLLLLFDIDKMF